MEGLLNFLSSNIIFLLIVAWGLMRLFTGNAEQNEERNNERTNRPRQQHGPKPTATPSGGNRQRTQPSREYTTPAQTIETISIEDQQKQQLEKLAGRMNTKMEQSIDDLQTTSDDVGKALTERVKQSGSQKEKNYRNQIRGNLSREGLVNSVIMAEVLGAPRGRKPYQSVVAQRKK